MYLYVVIGLGNPGKKYHNTRHNIGFDVLDYITSRNRIEMNKIKFESLYGEGRIGDERVIFLKPLTYMNNSGIAVLDVYNFYKVPIENIIVIVDDIDIEFGTVRLKRKGSAGTHNGLKSIIEQVGNKNFPRVKVGIGKPCEDRDLASYVLSKFSEKDRKDIDKSIENAALAVETIITKDINEAMNQFN